MPTIDTEGMPVPPQNLEAEQSVLGGMLIDRAAVEAACDVLDAGDFYRRAHGVIFTACREIASRQEPVDLVTLSNELRGMGQLDAVGGVSYLAQLADIVPTTANVPYYASLVFHASQRRRMIEAADRVTHWCYEGEEGGKSELIDRCETEVLSVGQRRMPEQDGDAAHARMLQRLYDGITGTPWELDALNEFAGAMSIEEPTLVGGETGKGKSLLVRDEVRGKCKRGEGCLVFSLELSEEKQRERLLAAEMGLSLKALRAGARNPDTVWRKDGTLAEVSEAIRRWPLVIDDRPSLTAAQMAARARRVKREMARRGVALTLIAIDYAGLMSAEGHSEYQMSKRCAEGVRRLAKELRVATLVITQVTKDGDKRGKPKDPMAFPLVHSRDAQDWAHAAAAVVWLHRPALDYDPGTGDYEMNKGRALLFVQKNRDADAQGVIEVGWDVNIGGFCDPPHRPVMEPAKLEHHEEPARIPYADEGDDEPDFGDPFAD